MGTVAIFEHSGSVDAGCKQKHNTGNVKKQLNCMYQVICRQQFQVPTQTNKKCKALRAEIQVVA